MIQHAGELRFLIESSNASGNGRDDAPPRDASALDALAIPTGVSTLVRDDANAFRLDANVDLDPFDAYGTLQLEPVALERRPALALFVPARQRVRINGAPAACVSVLTTGDQLQIDDAVLHLTFLRRPRVEVASPELVGSVCPVCQVQIEANSRVLVHDCGAALHLEPESIPEAERLACALIGCPVCEQLVELVDGYVFWPEL